MAVTQISVQELQSTMQSAAPPLLLDIRELEEWQHCKIDGAVHIPMSELQNRIHELEKSADVVVYCHHGVRSMHVAHFLNQNGYSRVTSLEGGIDRWSLEIDPAIPRY